MIDKRLARKGHVARRDENQKITVNTEAKMKVAATVTGDPQIKTKRQRRASSQQNGIRAVRVQIPIIAAQSFAKAGCKNQHQQTPKKKKNSAQIPLSLPFPPSSVACASTLRHICRFTQVMLGDRI
jgi:hypothetical protein